MRVELIGAEFYEGDESLPAVWLARLAVGQPGEWYLLDATGPGSLSQAELPAHFEARAEELARAVQEGGAGQAASLGEIRREAYRAAFTADEAIEAVFEYLLEGRPTRAEALQALRLAIKARFVGAG